MGEEAMLMADARFVPGPSVTARLRGRYLSVTSYKPGGTGVATPVWFVEDEGRLLVETDSASFKVKRIRANPSVTVAVCSATGRLRGHPVPAHAQVVEGQETLERIERLIKHKYRVDLLVIGPLRRAQKRLRVGRQRGPMVGLVITPA
jgi:uncharacterized protein